MSDDVLVRVEHVSKKFCRSLKRSLWYGLKDLGGELLGQSGEDRLELRRDEFLAVDDVSFELRRGECLGLIGANGAGKSTLLKMLNGLIRPDAGRIAINGRVGALIELGAGFNPLLTGGENIYVGGAVLGLTRQEIEERFDDIVAFSELGDFIDSPVKNFSSGMNVRLGMAIALTLRPDILLVDEVLAVGDTAFRMKCFRSVLELKRSGTAIALVSHNPIDIHRVCDSVLVFRHGKKIFEGDVSSGTARHEADSLRKIENRNQPAKRDSTSIASVKVTDLSRQSKTEFSTGDDLAVEVTIRTQEHVRKARLVVHVRASNGEVIGSFSSPHRDSWFELAPPLTTVRFVIRNLPLLVGSYGLSVGLYGEDIDSVFDSIGTAAHFQIISPPIDTFGFGVCHTVFFDHSWELLGRE